MKTYCDVISSIIDTIDFKSADKIQIALHKLPKMNIQKYKNIQVKKLLQMVIPENELLSVRTKNDYIKTFNAVAKFAFERSYIERPVKINSITSTVSTRAERDILTKPELKQLIYGCCDTKLEKIYKLLYLSGMRPSEVYKCSITVIDNIKCFDLTSNEIELKTKSSYRIIPVHKDIDIGAVQFICEFDMSTLSKITSKLMIGKKQTMYSLRHSFANDLIKSGVDNAVVSELLGHTHKGMTLSRYAKGYDINVLSAAIEQLSI